MAAAAPGQVATRLFRLSVGVFLVGGFLSATVGLLVPRMTLIAGASYTRALLIQLAFYSSYLVFAAPIALAIERLGYMRAIAAGLAIMAAACAALVAGLSGGHYPAVLAALLALSAGQTFLQIASNNSVALVGDPERAAARLTWLQGVNSLGTVAGPLIGAETILHASDGTAGVPFVVAGAVLAALAAAFFVARDLLVRTRGSVAAWTGALRSRRALGGAAAIFAYVGAEVTLAALATDFLVRRDVLGADPATAGRLVALYWTGAMVGRFAGAALLGRVRPAMLLAGVSTAAAALVATAATASGWWAAAALLAVGLANAIQYPTIYVLAMPDDPAGANATSTLLCMAVVGGAAVPFVTGAAADRLGLAPALAVPAACYLVVLAFALARGRTRGQLTTPAAACG